MPTTHSPIARARTRDELRLEQIAIWGDAAAQRPRSLPLPQARPRDTTQSEKKQSVSSNNTKKKNAPRRRSAPPNLPTVPSLTTKRRVYPSASQQSTLFTPPPFDLPTLERDISVLHASPPPPVSVSGTFAHCNSQSAQVFRKSGMYAAVARASVRTVRREEQVKRMSNTVDDLRDMNPERVVVTRRRNTMSIKGGHEYKVATTGMRGRSESLAESWRPGSLPRRHSDAKGKVKGKGKGKAPDVNTLEDEQEVLFKHRRETIGMRERDENDFRQSNAKLPERDDQHSGPSSAEWINFRRARKSTPILGRYTRSRSSQLPIRTKSRRQAQTAHS